MVIRINISDFTFNGELPDQYYTSKVDYNCIIYVSIQKWMGINRQKGAIIMARTAEIERITNETRIRLKINLDGKGTHSIATGIPFFDHMLILFAVHGLMDLEVEAAGDIDVDYHHTVEDVGLVLGDVLKKALGDKKGITRYGHVTIPMDDALTSVTIDLSDRPFLIFNLPEHLAPASGFDPMTVKEFFRAFSVKAGMNLHINTIYGENNHHIIESIFKATARALDQAVSIDSRITGIPSSKGTL